MKKMFKLSSTKKILTIVVNKLKKNKKKILVGLSVFLVVFISVFSFINLRYPTKINSYIAHVINKGKPANNYFEDVIFYKAVVDAYNKENKTSLPYTTNLTDEQLKSIKWVSYSGSDKSDSEMIKSTTGVEKLTALKSLELDDNNLSTIDLSKNTKLIDLHLSSNGITSIDLSHNTSLYYLELGSNGITSIDLSKNTALTNLELGSNGITSIDLSHNTSLTSLELDGNNLSNIDLSKNTSLTYLHLHNNNLSSIDLSKNTKLTYLDLEYNEISTIDLSKNTSLTKLNLYKNNLSSIDLSKNTKLTSLNLENNKISSIKLYDNFDISKLKDAIKNQNTYQTNLDLGSNRIINLTKDYKYYFSKKIIIPSEVDLQTFIDNLGLQNLTAKIFNDDEEISSGKIKYGYILKLYYEDIEVDSVTIKILKNSAFEDEVFYKAVVDAYNKENKTSLPYTTNLTDEQLKSIKNVSYSGYKKSDSERIKSTTGVEKLTALTSLELEWNSLSTIDLSHNTSLTSLELDRNNLSTIDLSKNTSLRSLDLWYNSLSTIDLSKNTALTFLNLGLNGISTIDLSKNTSLTTLHLDNNKISTIDLSKNTSLRSLNLWVNNISNIDLSKNTSLTTLYLENNKISNIDLSKNTKLTSLDLSSNKISTIDLSKNTKLTKLNLSSTNTSSIDLSKNTSLTTLHLENNKISTIDLSKNTSLTTLYLYDNPLKLNAYVKENGTLTSSSIKMPEGSDKFYLTYEIEDNSVVNFADNKLNGLKVGKTNATVILNGVKVSSLSQEKEDMKIDGTITVFNVTSKKYKINNEKKYIYTKTDKDFNTILSNINFQPISGKIENNEFILYHDNVVEEKYFIINISSNKYNLTKDNIRVLQDEVFDLEDIKVTNGTKEYLNNKLYIKYNDDILKVFTISARANGDINNDDKITIADVSLLYRHVRGTKVIEDSKTLEVSDLTGDDKITIADVAKLYRYVRGKINEL